MVYSIGKNNEAFHKSEKEELYDPNEISPRIEEVRKEGHTCGFQALAECHRGEVEVRGINTGAK